MSEQKKPWMKFYPADWQSDDGLRQCSLTARGLWIEMIAIMHKSKEYGHLLIAGVNPSLKQLATAAGTSDVDAVASSLAELEQWNVLSRRDDGVIYSRRMIEDARKTAQAVENGRNGGNPALNGGNSTDNIPLKPGVNPPDNGGDKTQKLEARSQKEEERELTLSRPGESDVETLEAAKLSWNRFAQQHGLSQVNKLTSTRKKHLRARLRDCGGLKEFEEVMARIPESRFLLGLVNHFRASFDFLVQQDGFNKISEGGFSDRRKGSASSQRSSSDNVSWMLDVVHGVPEPPFPKPTIDGEFVH